MRGGDVKEHPKYLESLQYKSHKAAVLSNFISSIPESSHAQMYILQKGIKKFGAKGVKAAKEELRQIHDQVCFRALAVKALTRRERHRAQEGLMLLSQEKNGTTKGQLALNGKPTRAWIGKEDKSSPTAHTESIVSTCVIDARGRRDIMSLDIPNTFIQMPMVSKPGEERVIMKVCGRLVDWLVALDPIKYLEKVVYERGIKVLYLKILQAIYGMLIASLLCYRKLKKDLEELEFVFNVYHHLLSREQVNCYLVAVYLRPNR